ncbi:MAG: DNA modification methylase [Sedimentisphaerales bacterium]|nr:DNA modification methylase [Sedimentisphaerales bacterium]
MARKKQQTTRIEPKFQVFRLDELNPAVYNPRIITDEAMTGLRHSLAKYGCVEPIVVNVRDGQRTIVGGHQRHKALLELHGAEAKVTCVAVDLDSAEEKLLNLALNNPHIQGDFIEDLDTYLDSLLIELPDDKDYLDLQIDKLRSEMDAPPEKTGCIEDDDIPEPPKEAITRHGDLWILGQHRLLCGDSTNPNHVARLMDNQKASLFATDPPYCVNYTGMDRPNGGKDWSDVYREVDIPDAAEFMKAFYQVGLEVIQPNTALYLWHASKRRREIEDVCDALDILIHQQIIWVKPCVILTYSFYSWRHEPCLLMWKRGQKPPYKPKDKSIGSVWPVGYVRSGDPTTPEYYTDVWELDWDGKKRPVGFDHPTSKPV